MKKFKISQEEANKIVCVERVFAKPTRYGIGTVDVGFQTQTSEGNQMWQYKVWGSIMTRSFCPKFKAKNPTYKDVTCCDEWLSFANFLGWANHQTAYNGRPQGFALDKDIIYSGNKTYSPDVCGFVPVKINGLIVKPKTSGEKLPEGVTFHKATQKYLTQIHTDEGRKHLGLYSNPEEAFLVYRRNKKAEIKRVAETYKGLISERMYIALLNYQL